MDITKQINSDILIVGAGIAGLTALERASKLLKMYALLLQVKLAEEHLIFL